MRNKDMSWVNTRSSLLWNLRQCSLVQLNQRIREFPCLHRYSRDLPERTLLHCTSLHPTGQCATSYKTSLSLASLLSINIKFEKSTQKTVSISTHYIQVISPNSQWLFPFSTISETKITFRNVPSSVHRPRMPDSFGKVVLVFEIDENGKKILVNLVTLRV